MIRPDGFGRVRCRAARACGCIVVIPALDLLLDAAEIQVSVRISMKMAQTTPLKPFLKPAVQVSCSLFLTDNSKSMFYIKFCY